MNFKEIKDLVKLIEGTEISEFSWESEGTKVTVKKGYNNAQPAQQMLSPAFYSPPVNLPGPPAMNPVETPVPEKAKTENQDNLVTIYAPMVGTFYRAPGPDAEPYVQIGQVVEAGQVLCIIEAMKLMNEIENEIRGRVAQILVENAQPVEYGQPLFVIEKI